ncbi:MAG: protein kinase, partial [Planctomycetes bacterium]|nr:protein kinase [Planctomycetota bacterium]
RRRFEAAWAETSPGPIEAFLPAEDDARFLPTLEELVHIEMEFAWKRWAEQRQRAFAAGAAACPTPPERLESHLNRFPRLQDRDAIVRLLRQEWRVRQQYGDSPSAAEYFQCFPEFVDEAFPFAQGRDTAHAAGPGIVVDTTMISTAAGSTALETKLPRRFGNYELLEELGRGGMGVVYRARQTTADRVVALKVVRRDLLQSLAADSSNMAIERFRHEVQAAAGLEHDNIITVYEVGQVAGEPFFSMQYVEGRNLIEILREGPILCRRAAEYLEPVARAVEAAHRHGILHRDLKPQNILVDVQTERPYVVDFGLAKLQQGGDELTHSGDVMGSPPYMSPEQAKDSAHVTAQSDVYALGATFYHLLTGRPPFHAATCAATIRQVIEQEPVAPRRLDPSIDVDLETLCLKCLEKEPGRRYATAEALADDLARYLGDEPILARPIGPFGRVARWCRRNPLVAGLLVSTATFLLFGLIATAVGYVRTAAALKTAETGYRHARETVDQFFTCVSEESLLNQHGMQPLRRDLLRQALAYYEQFLQERGGDPRLEDEVASTCFRIGRISEQIDSPEKALDWYRRALSLQQKLWNEQPHELARLESLADTWNALGGIWFHQRNHAEAETAYRRAIDLRKQLAGATGTVPDALRALANSYMNLGLVKQDEGQLADAEVHMEEGQELRRRALQLDPTSYEVRRDLGLGCYNLAVLCLSSADRDVDQAETQFAEAITWFSELLEENQQDLDITYRLAVSCRLAADLRAYRGRLQDAEDLYRRALENLQTLSQRNPDVAEYQAALGRVHMNVGQVQNEQQRILDAGESFRRAVEILTSLVESHPSNEAYRRDLAVALRALASTETTGGELELAQRHLDDAQAHLKTLVDQRPNEGEYRELLDEILQDLEELSTSRPTTGES